MANFIVTTLADTLNPNDGLSLREALALANGTPGSDTITFAPGLFGGTLVLTNGPLLITHDGITINGDINGNGHADITIDAAGASQVFNISDGTNAISAALDGLVIENGHVGGSGGGIFVGAADALTLTNSIVTGNSAYRGGGIYGSTNAHITLTNSTVSGNSSKGIYGSGAGIFVYNGTITLTNSTVSGNSAAGEGGGIQGYGSSNHITLLNSTVSGNSATHYSGGGINVGGGALTLTNSTVSGNSAPGGGGIVGYVGAAITLINSTVTGNSAGDGGGIAGFGAAITLANSIVLGNAATHGNDLFAAPALGGFPGSSLVFTGGNIIGSNPENFATTTGMPTVQLNGANQADLEKVFAAVANDPHTGVLSGVLADNGGPVQTVALNTSAANPAHGSGDAALLVEANIGLDLNGDGNLLDTITTDARGLPRIDGAGLDLGAFEIQTAAPVMLDAVPGKQLTTLSGTATPNTSVSILDNGNLVGTAIAGADGEWSLSVNVPGGAKGGCCHP